MNSNFPRGKMKLRWWKKDMKLRFVTFFPSKRNFVPKFSLCWSLKFTWWKDDDIWEFQRTYTIGIRLCFNCLTTRSMSSVGSLTRSVIVIWVESLPMESWVTHLKVISWDLENVKHVCVTYCSLTRLKSDGH